MRYFHSVVWYGIYACVISGCGNGDEPSSATVSGVASIGAPITGSASLKDGAGSEASAPVNGESGQFSIPTDGRQPPYILKAGSLFSISGGTGRANINPFSNLLVAEAGKFSTMADLDTFYGSPEQGRLQGVFASMSTARRVFHQKLDPLLSPYALTDRDPISDELSINQGYGRLFNDVRVGIDGSGVVTMTNRNNVTVFTSQLGDLANGTLVSGSILPPSTATGSGTIVGPTTFGTATTTGTPTVTGTGTTTTTGTTTGTGVTGTGTTTTGTTGTATTGTTITGPATGITGTTTIGPAATGTTITPTTTTITPTTINPTTATITPTTTTVGPVSTIIGPTGTATIVPTTATGTIGTTATPITTTTISPTIGTIGTSTTPITTTTIQPTTVGTGTTATPTTTTAPTTTIIGTTGAGTGSTGPGSGSTGPGSGTAGTVTGISGVGTF